jgi:hypothetical protein
LTLLLTCSIRSRRWLSAWFARWVVSLQRTDNSSAPKNR